MKDNADKTKEIEEIVLMNDISQQKEQEGVKNIQEDNNYGDNRIVNRNEDN